MQKITIIGLLSEFVRYKYSFHEYLYRFMREAQQTPSKPWASLPVIHGGPVSMITTGR
jgi:hypothetical protein